MRRSGKRGITKRRGCSCIVIVLVVLIGIGVLASCSGLRSVTEAVPATTQAADTHVVDAAAGAGKIEPEESPEVTPDDSTTPVETPTPTPSAEAKNSAGTAAARAGTAAAALAKVQVKGRAPKTGYTREQFGAAWTDVDRNGCDTRNDILGRDLTGKTYRPGTHDCVVAKGTLADPYTATRIDFVRGQSTSSAVQIDHVVALSDAWQKGAQQLSAASRQQLANDPMNLLAVDGPANMAKGDGDAATWLPPNRKFRCQYVARQVAVKTRYHLWMTQAEHDAVADILSGCPGEKLPTGGSAGKVEVTSTKAASKATSTPKKATAKKKATKKPAAESEDVYYKNCDAVKAAGVAPIPEGKPGYRPGLDRDHDGYACE